MIYYIFYKVINKLITLNINLKKLTMSETIYNQRVKNTNSFNSIHLTFFKNNNVKIEIENSYFTKNGSLKIEITKAKTTKAKIEDFLKNCDSFYESLYKFDEHEDFLKFKKTFINN